VNKIRESLGDSASSPRFIETLARRGYRFIAPVDGTGPTLSPSNGTLPPAAFSQPAPPSASEEILHPDLHVPLPRRGLVRGLFVLIQVMYLVFYLSALSHLRDVDQVTNHFLTGWKSILLVGAVLLTGTIGTPLRFYLISAVAFDFRRLGESFRRLFPFVLVLDQLWAVTPFLLLPQIGIGLAFAATAALLYVPFSERTLIRMAYQEK
jgi:cholera toxin transcriptional activator